jgi:hypothetical protein
VKTKSKIQTIRDEFERIGCPLPRDPFAPRLDVYWHFDRLIVTGTDSKTFGFEVLMEILKTIPDSAGEPFFWKTVAATDMVALCDRLNRESVAAWRRDCQRHSKARRLT